MKLNEQVELFSPVGYCAVVGICVLAFFARELRFVSEEIIC